MKGRELHRAIQSRRIAAVLPSKELPVGAARPIPMLSLTSRCRIGSENSLYEADLCKKRPVKKIRDHLES